MLISMVMTSLTLTGSLSEWGGLLIQDHLQRQTKTSSRGRTKTTSLQLASYTECVGSVESAGDCVVAAAIDTSDRLPEPHPGLCYALAWRSRGSV